MPPRTPRDFRPRESHQSAPGAYPGRAGSPSRPKSRLRRLASKRTCGCSLTPVCPVDRERCSRRRIPRQDNVQGTVFSGKHRAIRGQPGYRGSAPVRLLGTLGRAKSTAPQATSADAFRGQPPQAALRPRCPAAMFRACAPASLIARMVRSAPRKPLPRVENPAALCYDALVEKNIIFS